MKKLSTALLGLALLAGNSHAQPDFTIREDGTIIGMDGFVYCRNTNIWFLPTS